MDRHAALSLLTVTEKEALYMRREIKKALAAGEFLKSMGYPGQKEAVALIRDGNIKNIPHTIEDVKRYYDVYGPPVPGIRGKTMNRRLRVQSEEDRAAKMQVTSQEMTADVIYVAGQKLLVSVSRPLALTLVQPVPSLTKEMLGKALQAHINTLRSRGFEPRRICVNPHKPLQSLRGSFPGTDIDVSGAGDHLNMA